MTHILFFLGQKYSYFLHRPHLAFFIAFLEFGTSPYYPSKRADSDPNRICVSDWLKTFEKDLDYTIQARSNVITTITMEVLLFDVSFFGRTGG